MEVHVIDGTYELFRHYFALPSARDQDGLEVAAVRGVLASVLGMIQGGATHVAVATDHVIESFRNALWPGYKTGEGIEPDLLAQFPLLDEVLVAPMSLWMNLASNRSSESRRNPFPTTWLSWATRQMDIPACVAGVLSRQPLCSRSFCTLNPFPKTPANGE